MKVRLVKIGSLPGGEHSTYAEIGKPFEGTPVGHDIPTVGFRYNVIKSRSIKDILSMGENISTSPVIKIVDENIFETLNSIYKWEKIED